MTKPGASAYPGAACLNIMRRQSRAFLLSMGFLSRLGPAMSASTQDMRLACVYYPAVGAVLGCLMTLPFSLGCFAGFSWIQAWLYVLLSLWLTRAMHLDGLADLLDALGSAKDGEAFQAVLKDSRIGAFACIGLLMALGGQIILAAACFEQGSFLPLAYAPVFGRCLPVVLAHIAPANPGAQLGALLADCPRASALLFALLCLFGVFFCLPLPGPLCALVLAAACLHRLRRVALRQGGYNGDFCGFAIVAGETAVLLAALV